MILLKIALILFYFVGLFCTINNAVNAIRKKHYALFAIHCTLGIGILLGIIETYIGG